MPADATTALSQQVRELAQVDPWAERIARWLDSAFRVPGTSWRFGLDAVLGLLAPGLGDVVTGSLGAYLFFVAVRRRVPLVIIARMAINILIDTVVGSIPVLGDVFDFAWKANQKNLELVREHGGQAIGPAALDYLLIAFLTALVLAVVLAPFFIFSALAIGFVE